MSRVASLPRERRHRSIDLGSMPNHIVLEDVSWDFYERLLKEIGNRQLRIAYDDGRLEIMSPRWDHENPGAFIGRLVGTLTLMLDMPIGSGGSTTFRSKKEKKGAEPDRCFYFKSSDKMRGKKGEWKPQCDPPPELVIEVDLTSKSVDREPIYAALGVPEMWRWDGFSIECLVLHDGRYVVRARSKVFPFLEPSKLKQFLERSWEVGETRAVKEFMAWVKKNGWAKSSA